MGEIGKRTAEAIRKMAAENDTSISFELNCLKAEGSHLFAWEHDISDPRASTLATLARNGYDVIYILTGEKKNEN